MVPLIGPASNAAACFPAGRSRTGSAKPVAIVLTVSGSSHASIRGSHIPALAGGWRVAPPRARRPCPLCPSRWEASCGGGGQGVGEPLDRQVPRISLFQITAKTRLYLSGPEASTRPVLPPIW